MKIQSFLFVVLATISVRVFGADYQVAVDLDDTIKITNVADNFEAISRTFFSDENFVGMDTLLQSFRHQQAPISIVSGGLEELSALTINDLNFGQVPFDQLFLRDNIFETIFDFKFERFARIVKKDPRPIILIGDDTQEDPETSLAFRAAGNKVPAIYIHQVAGRKLPANVIGFYSAYEVALSEFAAGRLTRDEVKAVGQRILGVDRSTVKLLFPDFAVCPLTANSLSPVFKLTLNDNELELQAHLVSAWLVSLCNLQPSALMVKQ